MCGIAGIIEKDRPADAGMLRRMLDAVAHRGPDDEGVWMQGPATLGQRRLAIIDLSERGKQPMVSPDQRFVITFNGEIYNYRELRQELEQLGWQFVSASDTEVLLCAYIQWRESSLHKLNGMFAFAVWDNQENVLFAARDRLGEKPFKYYCARGRFVFASEIKALLQDTTIPREVDWQAIDSAFSLRFVPSPFTGFKHIAKLPAGHYLLWKGGSVTIHRYWDAGNMPIDEKKTYEDWKRELWDLFVDSVRKRMISDVPLGAFLSGGIDSTSVVAAMSQLSPQPVKTFVISLQGTSPDQEYAELAARFYNTDHHRIELHDLDYAAELERLVQFYDEPFFDQSALPSLLISRYIKQHVTVVLSGDGGDELFGGYDAYRIVAALRWLTNIPGLRLAAKLTSPVFNSLAYRLEITAKDCIAAYVEYYALWKSSLPVSRRYVTKEDLYQPAFRRFVDGNAVVNLIRRWFQANHTDIANQAMLADIRGRLADGYMTKTDIATMSSALELRPPFLDYRLVEAASAMPSRYKIKGGGKSLWKDTVRTMLPPAVIARKKMGFAIPLADIMKQQLRPLIEGVVLSDQSRLSAIFSRDAIQQVWNDHMQTKADYSNHLWSLLVLELWLRHYLGK